MQVGYINGNGEKDVLAAVAALETAGCARVVIDSRSRRQSGSGSAFSALLGDMRNDDLLMVVSLDHLASGLGPLVERLDGLVARGIRIRTLSGDFDTAEPGTARSLQALKAFSVKHTPRRADPLTGRSEHGPGRPPRLTAEDIGRARDLYQAGGRTAAEVARQLGVSRATLYRSLRKIGPSGA